MFSYRANVGMNVGGAPAEADRLPDLELDKGTGKVRQPTAKEARRIEKEKKRIRELPVATKAGYAWAEWRTTSSAMPAEVCGGC